MKNEKIKSIKTKHFFYFFAKHVFIFSCRFDSINTILSMHLHKMGIFIQKIYHDFYKPVCNIYTKLRFVKSSLLVLIQGHCWLTQKDDFITAFNT